MPCIIVSPWTVGGYVCHDTFDHTSVIQLLEQVTGVVNPNISAWRRQDHRRLHRGAGRRSRAGGSPGCPATTAGLELAEQQVREFPLPAIPGANQAFPVQPPGAQTGAEHDRPRER